MDITGHPLESLRGDPKLQESVEKKTLSADSTFSQKSPFGSGLESPYMDILCHPFGKSLFSIKVNGEN